MIGNPVKLTDKVLRVISRDHLKHEPLSETSCLSQMCNPPPSDVTPVTRDVEEDAIGNRVVVARVYLKPVRRIIDHRIKSSISISPKVTINGQSCLDLEVLHPGDGVTGGCGDQDGFLLGQVGPQQDQQHPGLPEVSHEGRLKTKVAFINIQFGQFATSVCSSIRNLYVLTQVSVNH